MPIVQHWWHGSGTTIPAMYIAVGMRKIVPTYAGSWIKVRRSSDNTTQDIGFSGNSPDTAALLTFCGVGNGFVHTWYDQTGNALHYTQTTNSLQPSIVNAGAVRVNANGNPQIYFDGADFMFGPDTTGFGVGFTALGVAGVNADVTYNAFLSKSTAGGVPSPFDIYNDSFVVGNGVSLATRTLSTGFTAAAGYGQWSFAASASATAGWLNGASIGSGGASVYSEQAFAHGVYLGGREQGATHLDGNISEMLIWNLVLTTAQRQDREAAQKAFYGTP